MRSRSIDAVHFQKILSRNIALPLGLGVLSTLVFVGMVLYLLTVLSSVEHTQDVIGNANHLSKLTIDAETGMRGYLITGDETFLAPYQAAKPQFDTEFDALARSVSSNPAQVDRLRRINTAFQTWSLYAEAMITLRRAQGDYLTAARAGHGKQHMDLIRSQFTTFIDLEQHLRQLRSDHAQSATVVLVSLYLLLNLGLAGAMAVFGRRELLAMSALYDAALKQQVAHNDLLQHTAWIRSGQSGLLARTVTPLAVVPLADALLDFVTHYLGGAVSALYVRENTHALRRIATYGFSHPAGLDGDRVLEDPIRHGAVFASRESLVGQAAHQNRLIRLDDVPPDYIQVSSALGASTPRHLIIAPLVNAGKVNAVIEIGFMRAITPADIEFLDAITHTVGSVLDAALQRERLADLLAETQQLNEELQVQQEELRVTNEELEEQSHALAASHTRLETQQRELEQSNAQLLHQTAILDVRNAALERSRLDLEDRAQALERSSRYKSEFLANMSHELRTPLNSALILARLLSENTPGNLQPEQITFARTIYAAGNDLLELINDILDIAKVEAGKLELECKHVPVQRILQALSMTFAPVAAEKQLHFGVHVEANVPLTLHTDRQRVEQILKNLLSNAIKFTDAGAVTLSVGCPLPGQIAFTVSDSGIGIAAEHQERIFDAFSQADGTTSRKFGGTGLGLTISRDLAHLLGGRLDMHSTPGAGSQFTVQLPLTAVLPAVDGVRPLPHPAPGPDLPPAPRLPAAASFAADGARRHDGERVVLVIEDDPVFARVLHTVARQCGYRCLVALTADDGLMQASHHLPDAILLDLGLPDRSGLSVLQLLQATPATRHIPVQIISGSDHGTEALPPGAIGFAKKPASLDQLQAVFQKLGVTLPHSVKRLLLVEDDAVQRDSMMRLIASADLDIIAVASGEAALQALRTTAFDCMIVDLSLPDMQGNQLLERMTGDDIGTFPPIIVYTGRQLTPQEERDLMRYSRAIIIKGARSPERLLNEVALFLHKTEDALPPGRQTMLRTVHSPDRIFKGRTVLLVDDDVRNVFALTSALEQVGLSVMVARSGQEAITQLQSLPPIDLVLMDVMMPGMDGLEATRHIRRDPRFVHLPIIAVTAKATRRDHEHCLQAGASDYLAKPVDLARLHALLQQWLPTLAYP